MWWTAPALLALLVPVYHGFQGHHIHLRLRSLVRRNVRTLPTAHELRHASRSASQRWAVNAGWLFYISAAVALAVLRP